MDWRSALWKALGMGEVLESIREVQEFAAAMPTLQEIIANAGAGEVVEYECEDGFCVGFYLHRSDGARGFAVQRAAISGGATLHEHVHEETEVLVLCYGRLSVQLDDGSAPIVLDAPNAILFMPGQAHTVTALETSWVVGTTIPSSPGYPTRGAA